MRNLAIKAMGTCTSDKGLLLVISGPSGVGKGTIVKGLQRALPALLVSISATTRAPRAGEIDGVDYYFLSRDAFHKKIEEGQLLEWAEVYDNYYGTPLHFVQTTLARGTDVILEIDIQGALQVKEKFPEAVLIFIAPPSKEEQRKRLLGRNSETIEAVEKRLQAMNGEIKLAGSYDYLVVNDNVNDAIERIKAVIASEKCRPWRMQAFLDRLIRQGI